MIQEYLYEIIALILILTLIVVYFLTKRFKQEEKNDLDHIEQKTNLTDKLEEINNEITEIIPEIKEENKIEQKEETSPFLLNGEEEGSFGNIDINPFEKNKKNKVEEIVKEYRVKSSVPEHGKISKDNFKEFAGVKLLIAEDNVINQKVLKGLLADTGIKITIADDGQIALDILKENSDFDMVLMDAHMPRVDGFEATRRIRANPNYEHIVVVALSGDTAADDIKKMIDAGMQEQLEKPLRMEALYDVLYAYTKNTPNQESEFIEVIMTKELNGDKGLTVCGGDEEFYLDILNEFSQNYTNSAEELYKFLENNDIKNADAMLLDFIGITANIGADNIRNIAQNLKEAIKDTQEKSYITLIDEYEKHLKILLKDIEDYKNL